MKHLPLLPLFLSLSALPLCLAHANAQESAAPPEPTPKPEVEIKLQKSAPDEHGEQTPEVKVVVGSDDQGTVVVHKDARPKKRVTFLGVNTTSLPESVAAQLPLEKGTGLLVSFVAKDSPAEKAGIEANDVLVKADDHVLFNTAQLQTVVENRKEGEPLHIAFYRHGQEKTVEATLATQEKSGWRDSTDWGDWGNASRTAEFQAALAKSREEARHAALEARIAARSAKGDLEKAKGEWSMSLSALRDALKGIEMPADGLTTTFTKPGSAQAVTVDPEGIFLLTRKDGVTHLRATDKGGSVLFDGDVTTQQEQAKIPPQFSSKVQKLLKDFPPEPPAPSKSAPPAASVPPAPPVPAAPPVSGPPAADAGNAADDTAETD